jgi:hypothetical protein
VRDANGVPKEKEQLRQRSQDELEGRPLSGTPFASGFEQRRGRFVAVLPALGRPRRDDVAAS